MKKPLLAFAAKPPASLEVAGEKRALALFHETAQKVPAYKDFLAKEKVDHKKIKTIADFKAYVPVVDKKNYLSQYPLSDLCKGGDILSSRIISVSSGSSGTPFFWPRGKAQDQEGTEMHRLIYSNIFEMNRQKTLFVLCFSMGTWIAGSFTMAASFGYIDEGNPVSLVTPGLEKGEAINAIKRLEQYYDQIVIAGYPPFVKDIIEEGKRSGIKWSKLKTRLLMAGEAFSEEWRDYVLKLIHARNSYNYAINIYGSADAGILGHETPVSIILRRLYNGRSRIRQNVFGTKVLPSLVQYDPTHRYFERVGNELIFTTTSGIPLVRYNIKDTGGVLTYKEAIAPVEERFTMVATRHGVKTTGWQLPFVYLNGRKDFSVTIYAVNIYPENIKAALIDKRVRRWVTGRFTMATQNYSDMDQYFEVNVELAKDFVVKAQHQKLIEDTIVEKLLKLNTEFHKLHAAIGAKARPRVHLIPFGDTEHFARGVKHKWVKRS